MLETKEAEVSQTYQEASTQDRDVIPCPYQPADTPDQHRLNVTGAVPASGIPQCALCGGWGDACLPGQLMMMGG